MARRRGDTHRLIRWLWTSRRVDARLARAALLPLAGLWRIWMGIRVAGFRLGWVKVHDLPLPSVAVGNLTVGGSGKTPVAIWVAQLLRAQGLAPGILLRGYGGDESDGTLEVGARALTWSRRPTALKAPNARWREGLRFWCWMTPTSGSTSDGT